ncbi:MAG: hypothetical protein AAFP03_07525, partial [Cyanobacteria bacterium J06598_3]
MKYWEFLIQKEGDQTWLPLETQQVEILEGRYRVVAHTDRVNTPLDIRVSQLITSEMPPRKRVRKRTSQTNDTGLVVVMPYVHLKPGQWSLECTSSNVMDDLMGDGWCYGVELDVFGHTEEDWSSEWPVPAESETVASVIVDTDSPRKLAQQAAGQQVDGDALSLNQDSPLIRAKAELEQQLKSQGYGAKESESKKPVFLAAATNQDEITAAELSQLYRVSLRQQAYLARHNKPMTIMGKVNALVDAVPEGIGTETSQLWIRLQNPENTQVIMEAHRPLSLARLPADFKVQIQLPAEVTTRVILGEVSLRTAAIDANTPSIMLTSTAFTITAGIAQLLDSVANQDPGTFDEEVSVFPAITDIDPEARKDASPEISVPALDVTQKDVVPAVGVVLPPQLIDRPLAETALTGEGDEEVRSLNTEPTHQPALPNFPAATEPAAEELLTEAADTTTHQTANQQAGNPTQENDHNPQPIQVNGTPTAAPNPRDSMVAQPAQFIGTSILDGDLEADEIAAVLEDIDKDLRAEESDLDTLEPPGIEGALPMASQAQNGSHPTDEFNLYNGSQNNAESRPSSKHSSNDTRAEQGSRRQSNRQVEANIGFQSLKLKDHFWNKLSTLTHESHEEATQLAKNMKAAGVSRERSLPTAPDFIADDDEVVIYDEPYNAAHSENSPATRALPSAQTDPPRRQPSRQTSRQTSQPPLTTNGFAQNSYAQSSHAQPPIAAQSNPLGGTLATGGQPFSDEDLPDMVMPVISVPMGDLIAGETVTIIVRTRPATYKPFIKLWMIDRQSRSLVIDPVLLTSLVPDALGDLEGSVK